MPSSTFLSFCRYLALQKEKQAVPPPRPPPPLQTMLCCCPAACIRETTTKSTWVMVGGMGPDCFSNCGLFDDCVSRILSPTHCSLLQFHYSFNSSFPFSPFGHKTFYVIRPPHHGFWNGTWHIFYSFLSKGFFCPILGGTGANGGVDVATKIINTGILHVWVINRIVRGTVTYGYTTPGWIFALYHTLTGAIFSWMVIF